jgi:DNA-binding response OmpR family regulator
MAQVLELREATPSEVEIVALRELDRDCLDARSDVAVTGAPWNRSVGDDRALRDVTGSGAALLVVTCPEDLCADLAIPQTAVSEVLVSPYSRWELLFRLGRLANAAPHASIDRRGVTIDHNSREVIVEGQAIALTPREYAVLSHLARNFPYPVGRIALAAACHEVGSRVHERGVDQIVAKVRGKLGPDATRLETVPLFGYRLK